MGHILMGALYERSEPSCLDCGCFWHRGNVSRRLREHAGQLRSIGQDVWRTLVHILLGLVIGGMVAVSREAGEIQHGPLVHALTDRARLLGAAFRSVVFAQVRISALNTLLTGLYLLVIVPWA